MSDQLLGWLQQAGFKGPALRTAWAIARRESGGRPTAFNPNRSTGDQSYGLFQINMLGGMGPSRRRQFGIQSNEALFDPLVNAKAAYQMSKGGSDFGAWGIGRNAYRKMPALDFSGYPGENPRYPQGGIGTLPARGPGSGFAVPDIDVSKLLGGGDDGLGLSPPPGSTESSLGIEGLNLTPPSLGGTPSPLPGKTGKISTVLPSDNVGARAVKKAATQLGKPYVFGSGPDTSSFDCSDLVQWSYRQLGIEIPRDTWGQQKALPLKSWKDLRPGDPIYRKSGGHVVIYAGNGRVIAAPHTGTVVQYQPLSNFPQSDWEVRSVT